MPAPAQEDLPQALGKSEFRELFLMFWDKKIWVSAGTAVSILIGFTYCMLAKPIYVSDATISQKEAQGGNPAQSLLSQFGGLGGAVASSLGLGGSLDRMLIILTSRDLAEDVIAENDLLPSLYPDHWDKAKGEWKATKEFPTPTMRQGADMMKHGMISGSVNGKQKVLMLKVGTGDSLLSARILNLYLQSLNKKIKANIVKDAEANRAYLENQILQTSDPLLREKIQQLVAFEMEKSMLMASSAFDILEKPAVPRFRDRPKKRLIMLLSLIVGLLGSCFAVAGHRFFLGGRPADRLRF